MDGILIYSRVLVDMQSGRLLEAEAEEYAGDLAQCKGGSSTTVNSTSTPDYEYNARIAAVQERAQGLSDQYFAWWKDHQAPLEAAKADSELKNVGQQQKITQGLLNMQENSLGATSDLTQQFLNESLKGVNGEEWANRAGTDQQNAASNATSQLIRNASRMGLSANSGSFAKSLADQSAKNAAAVAGARTQAFRNADTEKYNRLNAGMRAGMGLLSQS